jgi:hypothetical protein
MYVQNFIIGGMLFVTIKYLSLNINNVKYASMIAAFPIGLISSYLILDNKLKNYVVAYNINILILLLSAVIFYILLKYMSRDKSLILSIIFWLIINLIYIHFF